MKRYGRRHTLPYLLSLALEYLAFSLRTNAAAKRAAGKATDPASEAERAETKKRANAFWWYIVRGPVWESWTKCVISVPFQIRDSGVGATSARCSARRWSTQPSRFVCPRCAEQRADGPT